MSRPSGRRPSSCDQCGSTAATEPRRGRPQVRWSTAMDGELGARGRAARATGRSAGCRGARRRGTPPLLPIGTRSTCVPAGSLTAAQVAGRRAAATKEHSASGRSALRVRGGTACLCRLFSRVSVYSERTRASGAASLAPGQPPDLISARPSAPTRMASDVLYSRYMSSFGQSFGGTFIGGTRRQSAFSLTHER